MLTLHLTWITSKKVHVHISEVSSDVTPIEGNSAMVLLCSLVMYVHVARYESTYYDLWCVFICDH